MHQIIEYFTSSIISGLVFISIFAAFVSFLIIAILDFFFGREE
jgi:hypothetical protein